MQDLEEIFAPRGLYQAEDEERVRQLEDAGVLLYAEPNFIITLDEVGTPGEAAALGDDGTGEASLFADEIVPPTDREDQWYFPLMGMSYARKREITGEGIRIGIVDSGVYAEHWDLRNARILPGTNYCVPEGDPERTNTQDTYGHGTFVTGLIAAGADGGGIAGLAPDVELVPLKAFSGKTGSVANVIAGIYGGVDVYGCKILNLSLGIPAESTQLSTLRTAITHAREKGVLLVSAVGNLTSGTHAAEGDPLLYPAAFDEVIGVGALASNKTAASFSYRNRAVAIVAPGLSLRSLNITGDTHYTTGGGTSYAAPVVVAAAALALSVRPDLSVDDLTNALCQTAWDLGDPGYDTTYGYGMLHVGSLLTFLLKDGENQAAFLAEELSGAMVLLARYDSRGALLSLHRAAAYEPDLDSPEREAENPEEADSGGTSSEKVEPASDGGDGGDTGTNPGGTDSDSTETDSDGTGSSPAEKDSGDAGGGTETGPTSWKIFALEPETLSPLRDASYSDT